MNISSISINRPVLASVISILIVLFGIVGFSYLGVREFPSVDPPVILSLIHISEPTRPY